MTNFFAIFCLFLNLAYVCQAGKCDADNQCPQGLVCRPVSYLPGTKACVYNQSPMTSGSKVSAKRCGRCPTTGFVPIAVSCNSNQDCSPNQKCCPLAYGQASYCVTPSPVGNQPTVTPIIDGGVTMGETMDFIGAATLVQSNCYNVLVDTGAPRMTPELLKNLWSRAGLTPEDMDIIVTTHGHPDHYASIESFSDVEQVFSRFIVNGRMFRPGPLASGQRYFLNNDQNLEVINSPGHVHNDISLIVRNVPNMGTVAIVGDLMLFKDDGTDSFAWNPKISEENRHKVACMSDYIVPGHGIMFKVDASQKSKFAC